jgi:lycopene cyclase domain-containing protein
VTYTVAAGLAVVVAVAADLLVLRTRLVTRRVFWVSYAIVVVFELVVDGVLTGRRLVRYDPGTVLGGAAPRLFGGWRVAYAPVEDLAFGFALILWTLAWWVWLGRLGTEPQRRRARRARTSPGTATPARRTVPTDTRRSSTR